MFQLPPLSHCASLSHAESGAAFAVPMSAAAEPAVTAPTTARRARLRPVIETGRAAMWLFSSSRHRDERPRQPVRLAIRFRCVPIRSFGGDRGSVRSQPHPDLFRRTGTVDGALTRRFRMYSRTHL